MVVVFARIGVRFYTIRGGRGHGGWHLGKRGLAGEGGIKSVMFQ